MPQLHTCFETWRKNTLEVPSYRTQMSQKKQNETFIIPFDQTKYVVFSSCLFLAPASVCYFNGFYIAGYCGFMTTIASINYWLDCKPGWRRNCDLIASRIMCVIGCYYFLTNIQSFYDYITFTVLGVTTFKLYCLASFQSVQWVKYHILFHCMLTFSGLLAANKMIQNKLEINNYNDI